MSDPIRTIVAGVAQIEDVGPVLQQATAMAHRLGATLHLVHAYTPPEAALGLGLPPMDLPAAGVALPAADAPDRQEVEESIRGRLRAQVARSSADLTPRLHVEGGSAHRVLARVAEAVAANLVLVGATRRGGLERMVLGTTAGRVLREVSVPILVLRQPLPTAGARVLLTTTSSSSWRPRRGSSPNSGSAERPLYSAESDLMHAPSNPDR